jgi:hypothetical protein
LSNQEKTAPHFRGAAFCIVSQYYFPVPLRETDCGLPVALSFKFNVAVRVPFASGVNVTEMVHLPFAGTLLPQVLVWAKSPVFVPVKLAPLKLKTVGMLLVRVTILATLLVSTV